MKHLLLYAAFGLGAVAVGWIAPGLVAGNDTVDAMDAVIPKQDWVAVTLAPTSAPTVELDHAPTIFVARHEVTVAQWQQCHQAGACRHLPRLGRNQKPDHPITDVNWLDAKAFTAWLSAQSGQTVRLPYDWEWQAWAADVLEPENSPKLFDDPRLAWAADYMEENKRPKRATQAVGAFGENRDGIRDLTGNVWEWTESCGGARPNSGSDRGADGRASGTSDQNCRGIRAVQGEHSAILSELIRIARPGGCSTGLAPSNLGFRVVRES